MRIAAAAAAALLCVAPLAHALCSGKACCSDCSTGQPYSGCTCLEDNEPVRGVVASAGEYRRFHYRITNWTLVAPEERKIGFRLTPCYGKVHLLIDTVINGFPSNESARWRSDRFGEVRATRWLLWVSGRMGIWKTYPASRGLAPPRRTWWPSTSTTSSTLCRFWPSATPTSR